MEKDTEETIVIFRAERTGQFKVEVTAVFPCIPADLSGNHMACYQHIGQHSSCNRMWYWQTRPATLEEYAALAKELESIGYKLAIRKKITREMDDTRRKFAVSV